MKVFAKKNDQKAIKKHFEKYKKLTNNSPNFHISKEMEALYDTLRE
jgi:hypothetical protein